MNRKADSGRPTVSLGWHTDIPDFRDRVMFGGSSNEGSETAKRPSHDTGGSSNNGQSEDTECCCPKSNGSEQDWVDRLKNTPLVTGNAPDSCLNIDDCSPIEDQGSLGSCTAQAVVGMMEYMMRRGGDKDHVDGSRLFLYKVTRNLLGLTGDTGAYIRTALKAARAFGVPPEDHWPYQISAFDEEPSQFLYSFAGNYKAVNYARIDTHDRTADEIIDHLERLLASGFVAAFGFSVYDSLTNDAFIPFPDEDSNMQGGHAVMAVGYDRNHEVDGVTVPSLIIRNSWGEGWGIGGYGYLPYDYILKGLARDFWTVYKWDWIEGFE